MIKIRYLIPFFDFGVSNWAIEARLVRWLTMIWMFMGLVVLFSASYPVADAEVGDGFYYFKRQIIWILLGTIAFNIVARSPFRYLLPVSRWILFVLLGLMIAILIPGVGTTVNGATRWITVASIPIQPSELIKPFLVVQSASVFGRWKQLSWLTRVFWLGIFAIILGGILLQPNLSTTALCGMTLWLMAVAAGLPWLQLGSTAVSGILLAVGSIYSQEYQRRRIMSFLDPWQDPMQDGYQLIQSLLAVGSGGIWGSGFGLSQQKLFYLPIQYTDFIFAVFAEEFGFVGSIILLILLITYATLAVFIALRATQPIQKTVAIGVMILLIGQSSINIGVATGVLPTTGLPLPFFSYGGSSIISSLILAGLLVRVARESNEAEVVSLQGRREH
ncbi:MULTISPECIES: FtsW/RodA/SpoVE family cell cycle protein [Spirulina sp. CCY15215]|uniref:FtsW/RodA/SpoVE family cell cycle protein n=1 Tax=Spirulina sp. CCY15215 TaxID=2767591 RepID=UPI00194F826B|nr:FtsW/RodA/SpoVE family cell cycle protein [Spirulina major]